MPSNDANANATGPMVWVMSPAGVSQLIESMRTASEVVLDLETTGLDEHAIPNGPWNGGVAARISLAAFTLPQEGDDGYWDGETPVTYILPLSHPDSPFSGTWRKTLKQVLLDGIVATKRALTNANVKFDARWCWALCGVNLAPFITWDTEVSSHLLDELSSTKLKERAPATFGIDSWADFALDYPGASEQVPLFELGEYGGRDTWWTWRLKQQHTMEMFLRGGGYPTPILDVGAPEAAEDYVTARLGKVATWVSMPTVRSLTQMEQNGIRLDVNYTRDRLVEEIARREGGLDRLAALYDMDRERASTAPTSHWFLELTRRAVDDKKLRILSMTKNGNPQWTKGILAKLTRQGYTVASDIREQRVGQKRAEFLSSWLSYVKPDGRVHTQYRAGWVSTGRLSSKEPNMQQVSKVLRPCFIPADGCVMADFDFSQIELRVAAFLARCQPMIDAFNAGEDLHRILGSYITGKPPELVTADERQGAKSANFGLLYLQSPEGFRNYAESVYGVVLSAQEAAQFHQAFFERWTGMHEWHESVKAFVRSNGYIVSPLGRVRRLPAIWSGNQFDSEGAERQAVNSPVQGTASDLMQIAAADVQGLLPGTTPVPGVRLVATVHDSIAAELRADMWQEAAAEVKARMERSAQWLMKLNVNFDVPVVADVSVGTRWSWNDVSDPAAFAKDHPELAAA